MIKFKKFYLKGTSPEDNKMSETRKGKAMTYEKGSFGKATFIAKKDWNHKITCYGRVIDFDNKCIQFVDNEDTEYIIDRNKFEFEIKPFKILT